MNQENDYRGAIAEKKVSDMKNIGRNDSGWKLIIKILVLVNNG